ncbi:MAG: hypothetical protein ACFFAU_20510 [Candidatus Hodarchaeota archaeon]
MQEDISLLFNTQEDRDRSSHQSHIIKLLDPIKNSNLVILLALYLAIGSFVIKKYSPTRLYLFFFPVFFIFSSLFIFMHFRNKEINASWGPTVIGNLISNREKFILYFFYFGASILFFYHVVLGMCCDGIFTNSLTWNVCLFLGLCYFFFLYLIKNRR